MEMLETKNIVTENIITEKKQLNGWTKEDLTGKGKGNSLRNGNILHLALVIQSYGVSELS